MTPQRQRILEIATEMPLRAIELAQEAGVGVSVVKALAKDGALEEVALPAHRPFRDPHLENGTKTLSDDQRAAAEVLKATIGTSKVTLLDGVTGSGKTEVYFEAMAEALRRGKQVLAAAAGNRTHCGIPGTRRRALRLRARRLAFGFAAART